MSRSRWDLSSPNPALNLHPLHWKHRVLNTGPSEKSPRRYIWKKKMCLKENESSTIIGLCVDPVQHVLLNILIPYCSSLTLRTILSLSIMGWVLENKVLIYPIRVWLQSLCSLLVINTCFLGHSCSLENQFGVLFIERTGSSRHNRNRGKALYSV